VVLKSNKLNKLINRFKENEILSKSSSAFIFKIIGSLSGYVFLLLVTRISGAEVWGIFVLCMALLNITSILSRFGVDTALLRFVAQLKGKKEEIKGIYLQGFSLVLALSIAFSILLYFFSNIVAETVFQKPHLRPYFKVIAFALIPFTIIHLNAQTFRALKRIKEFAFYQHISKFLLAVIIFVLLFYFTNMDPIAMPIYSFLAAVVIVMIFSGFGIFKTFKGMKAIIIFSKKGILRTAYPMMLSSSTLLLMAWADTIMIGIYKTDVDVGVYNIALKLAMVTTIALGAVNSILAPKLSDTFNNNNRMDEFKVLIKQSTRIIFFISLPILIFLLLFPEFFLSLFGQEFAIAKTTLLILLIGQAVNTMSGSVGFILQMTGKEKIFQNILLLALICNIILNIFLIPIFGINGAAISSSFSLVFWNLSTCFYIYKKYNVLTFLTIK